MKRVTGIGGILLKAKDPVAQTPGCRRRMRSRRTVPPRAEFAAV
jgi:hypothetical protein